MTPGYRIFQGELLVWNTTRARELNRGALHGGFVPFGRKRHGRATPLVKRVTTFAVHVRCTRVCAYINTGVRACIYVRLLREHMAPVAARLCVLACACR